MGDVSRRNKEVVSRGLVYLPTNGEWSVNSYVGGPMGGRCQFGSSITKSI